MPDYRERLWPAPWMFLSTILIIPASILIVAPVSVPAGIVTAIVLYLAIVVALIFSAPLIEVADGTLRAGKARIPLSFVGEVTGYSGQAAWQQRGPKLDSRAWMLFRSVDGVVTIPVEDPADPAPYWIVSTRAPKKMAAAINGSRRPSK